LKFGTLLGVAWLTHVYLLTMVIVLFAASLVAWRLRSRPPLVHLAAGTAVIGMTLAVVGLVAGHFTLGVPILPDNDFGRYSMNLLAPVTPPVERLWLPKFTDPTGGQYEGMNYLG